jgi:FkbM family methyltransferase
MGNHIDILQIGAHIGNSINDPIYNKSLNNKSLILIEPIPFLFKILVHNYKVKSNNENIEYECLNIAISDKDGYIDIFAPSESCKYDNLPFWISQLGSTTVEHFQNHNIFKRFPDFKVDKIKVVCKSLNTLIKEKNITSIDTLLIDTEGHDYTILRALDLSIIKPKNIVFENKYMDGTFKKGNNYNDLTNYFINNGYKIVKEDEEDTYLELVN